MSGDDPATLDHYARLIEGILSLSSRSGFEPVAEDETAVQVERGVMLPMVVAGADADDIAPVTERLLRLGISKLRVVDAAGHTRPGYSGLLVYAWRRAMELLPCQPADYRWDGRLRDALHRTFRLAEHGDVKMLDPAAVIDVAWTVLALGVTSNKKGSWFFSQIAASQHPNGALLPADPSASPETYWYHELVLLHALEAYAVDTLDPAATAAAARAAEFHLNETQPDHATNEPWGLLAFIRNRGAESVADQMLHTVRVQHPRGPQGVTRILLADVLQGIRRCRQYAR